MTFVGTIRWLRASLLALFTVAQVAGVIPLIYDHTLNVYETMPVAAHGHPHIQPTDATPDLVAAGLSWGIGHSGAQGIGANAPDLITPGIFFGRGFGDLPDSLAWLRPFGITGAFTLEHPMTGAAVNFGVDDQTGQLSPMVTRKVDTLHWGFAVEFSTLYLTSRFTPGKLPKQEPLNQLVPLVEFSFISPRGEKTAATMNPGLSYVAVTWQVAAEAIVPLNSEAGRGVGGRAQLLLFLDDLIPSLFGNPLLSR